MLTPAFDLRPPLRFVLAGLFMVAMAFTVYFALFDSFPKFRLLAGIRGDHTQHGLAFACLAMLGHSLWRPAWKVLGLLTLGAAALELAQLGIAARQASWADFAASIAGIAGGAGLFALLWAGWMWWFRGRN